MEVWSTGVLVEEKEGHWRPKKLCLTVQEIGMSVPALTMLNPIYNIFILIIFRLKIILI